MSPVTFNDEITSILYSLGDNQKPDPDCVGIVAELVQRELCAVVVSAAELAASPTVQVVHVLAVLAHERELLLRLHRRVHLKQQGTAAASMAETESDDYAALTIDTSAPSSGKHASRLVAMEEGLRRVLGAEEYRNFMQAFDLGGGSAQKDTLLRDRQMRQAMRASGMNRMEYIKYSENRQISFLGRGQRPKLISWLCQGCGVDLSSCRAIVLDLLAYLAFEIVAILLDAAMLVRREARSRVATGSGAATQPRNSTEALRSLRLNERHMTEAVRRIQQTRQSSYIIC